MKKNPICLSAFLLFLLPLVAEEDFGDHLDAAKFHIRDEEFEEADKHFEDAWNLASDGKQKALTLAKRSQMMAYHQKKYPEAMAQIGFARQNPERSEYTEVILLQVEAYCLMKDQKDYPKAAAVLEKATVYKDVNQLLPNTYTLLGESYRLSKNYPKALDAYEQLSRLPDTRKESKATAHMNRGVIYQYRMKKEEPAKKEYQRAVSLNPKLKPQIDKLLQSMD